MTLKLAMKNLKVIHADHCYLAYPFYNARFQLWSSSFLKNYYCNPCRSCFLQMMIRKIRMIFVKSMNFDACTFYWCFCVCFLIANFIFISYHGWQSKPQVTLYHFQKWLRNIVVSESWSKNWSYKLVRWWGGAYTCFCIWTSPQASTWFVVSLWRLHLLLYLNFSTG